MRYFPYEKASDMTLPINTNMKQNINENNEMTSSKVINVAKALIIQQSFTFASNNYNFALHIWYQKGCVSVHYS